jgi:prolyl oligopeptidase
MFPSLLAKWMLLIKTNMNSKLNYLLILLVTSTSLKSMEAFNPPPTEAIPVVDTLFNYQIIDNYRWLEDKKDPKVLEWSQKQHDYTINYINKNFKQYPGMKDEIRAIYDRDNISAPFFKHDREFFYKKMRGEQQSKIYTKRHYI